MFKTDNEYYVITWMHKDKRYFADMEDGGYPHTSYNFSLDMIQHSLRMANKCLEVWTQFNMWRPEIGFTSGNVKIMKLNFELI